MGIERGLYGGAKFLGKSVGLFLVQRTDQDG